MKSYSKYKDILKQLREHVIHNQTSGNLVLESERDLISLWETSRNTLSKAIDTLVEEKLLYRAKQSTRIVSATPQQGRYAYVAYYHKPQQYYWHTDNAKIAERITLLATKNALKIDCLCFDPKDPDNNITSLIEQLQSYNIVFLSGMGQINTNLLIESLENKDVEIVLLAENNYHSNISSFTEDFYHSGKIAAQELLRGGYKHPLFMGALTDRNCRAITQLFKGFKSVMSKAQIDIAEFFPQDKSKLNQILKCNNLLSKIEDFGYDSIFFAQDFGIELITEPLYEQNLVPHKVGIISDNNGFHASLHTPPVTHISNSVNAKVNAMLELMLKHEINPTKELFHIRFKCDIISSNSIRNVKNN